MRKILIILISTAITALNVSTFGDLDAELLEKARETEKLNKEITLSKTPDLNLGINFFHIIHFAELMFLSEVSRKSFLS